MSPIRVLLVGVSGPFLAAAAAFLGSLPRVGVVEHATCAAESISNIDALRPTPVLMDAVMPGMDGFQTTGLVMERVDAPKVVIPSLHRTDAYRYLSSRPVPAARIEQILRSSPIPSQAHL